MSTEPSDQAGTATTAGARAHARAMAGTMVDTMPTMPPSACTEGPTGVDPTAIVWDETVAGGGYTSLSCRPGTRVRLLDRDGDACAGVLLHRIGHRSERLNVADTVKVQWQCYLHEGQLLLSDMGRVLATIVRDTSGRHDTICGTTNRAATTARYGAAGIEGPTPNGRDLFALSLAKAGRGRRDIAPNVNFFKGTRVAPDGTISLHPGPGPGGEVVLRCELDVLLTIVNVPHPLDDRPDYTVTPLRVTAWTGPPAGPDDPHRLATPEAERAFLNTDAVLAGPAPDPTRRQETTPAAANGGAIR
ncbi:MAG: urea amidolyase associated protein UAAP1 [Acidimicrobiales bacterium]